MKGIVLDEMQSRYIAQKHSTLKCSVGCLGDLVIFRVHNDWYAMPRRRLGLDEVRVGI